MIQIQTFWAKIKDSFFVALTAILTVLLVVLVVWFVIKVVPKTFSFFRNGIATTLTSVFTPNEDISTVDKKTISSGESFGLSLGDDTKGDLYTFYFPCTDGVSFSLIDEQKTKIECGNNFFLLNRDSNVSVTGFSTENRIVLVPIKIGVQKQDSQTIETFSDFKMTIINKNFSAPVEDTPVNTNTNITPTNNTYTSVINTYVGKADLSIKILDTGIINKSTLQFTKTSNISSTDRVGIKFEVKNIGDKTSGVWNFTATLPSQSSPSYQSDTQISLKPGDKIEFTLGFDDPTGTTGANIATINVDPLNYISEITKTNNVATVGITVSYVYNTTYIPTYDQYNYNNGYNYNYYGNLTASCYSIPASPAIGESVTWFASASGGNNSYTYYWTGTDNLVGSNQAISRVYYTGGIKNANVVVTSGGYTISSGCSTNVSNNNGSYGNTDLSVRLLGVGMLDYSNNFVYATQIPRNSNAAIKFEVTNNGTGNSGIWNLTSNMSPSMSWYTYTSNSYPSLSPGQKTEVTVNFSNADYYGDNYIYVKIDPNNYVQDSNRNNNNLTATIRVY